MSFGELKTEAMKLSAEAHAELAHALLKSLADLSEAEAEKFWLEPVALCRNHGFSPKELNVIRQLVLSNITKIQEGWDEHCG